MIKTVRLQTQVDTLMQMQPMMTAEEKAKAEIINGIKEYDAAHPDEKGGSEDE